LKTILMLVAILSLVKTEVTLADDPKPSKECREAQVNLAKTATATAIAGSAFALAPHPAIKAVAGAATAYGVAKMSSASVDVHQKCSKGTAEMGK